MCSIVPLFYGCRIFYKQQGVKHEIMFLLQFSPTHTCDIILGVGTRLWPFSIARVLSMLANYIMFYMGLWLIYYAFL